MADIDWSDFKPDNGGGIDKLVAAITHVESGGNTDATSPQGARGSMQIMPATFKQYAMAGESYANDDDRRAAATRKISDDYSHYGGDMAKTAAAYIGGRGAVRADGTIRDDVSDSLGTTPSAYADRVLARAGKITDTDWSQFKPVETDWSQFVPLEQTQSRVGQGRGLVNPPLVGQTQDVADAGNAAIDKKVAELQAINPGVSADRLRGMAISQMGAMPAEPVDRIKQYTAKGYDSGNAAANVWADERTEKRINKTALTAAPDERGNRAIQSYNPNTEADKTAALAAQYRANAPYANESRQDMRVRQWDEANPMQSAFADNYNTVAVNTLGGLAKLGTSAAAAGSEVVGAKDTANYFDEIGKNITGTMQENGGDTVIGKTASIIGTVAPMLLLPPNALLHLAATAGLFGVPAFRDTLNAKLDQGMDFTGAMTHAVASFTVNMAMPRFATNGTGALGRALGVAEKDAMGNIVVKAMGARGAATQLGLAGIEGAGFATGAALIDHSIDYALENSGHEMGEQAHRDLLDPKELLANALAFAALRGKVAGEHYTGEAGVKQAAGEQDFHINQMAQEIAGRGRTFDESKLWGLVGQVPNKPIEQKQPITPIEPERIATNTVAPEAPKADPIKAITESNSVDEAIANAKAAISEPIKLTDNPLLSIRKLTTPKDLDVSPTDGVQPVLGEYASEVPANPLDQRIQPTNSFSRTASWVIKNKATGEVVMETFDRKKVDALNTAKYEAVPILEHLQSLNNVKDQSPRANTEAKAAPTETPTAARLDATGQATARAEAGAGVLATDGLTHDQRSQDAIADVLLNEDGTPAINRLADIRAIEAWLEENKEWDNSHGNDIDTQANRDQGQAGTPDAAGAKERIANTEANDSSEQRLSNEKSRSEEGLTSPTREGILAQQDRAKRAEKLDAKAQIDKEASGQKLESQNAPEQRSDTSGDMFAMEKAQAEIDKRNAGKAKEVDANQNSMFSRDSGDDLDHPHTGPAAALLELGKSKDLYKLPISHADGLEDIAKAKGMTAINTRDANAERAAFSKGVEVDYPSDPMGAEGRRNLSRIMSARHEEKSTSGNFRTWDVETDKGAKGVLTQDGDRVWINVSGPNSGKRGNAIYDLAANYAHNNKLKFIGDPDGLSDAGGMRRRLENMLNASVKYQSTDFLEPHAKQLIGNKELGIPGFKWTKGDTLSNIRSMMDASVASNEHAQPIAHSLTHYEPATQSFADWENRHYDDEGLSEVLGFDSREKGDGKGGFNTLKRTSLIKSLLSGSEVRREVLDKLRDEQSNGNDKPSGASAESWYSKSDKPAVRNPTTVDNVQAAVSELIGGKQLPNELGRIVATTAAEIKSYWEPLIDKKVNIGSEGDGGVAQAFYDPRTKTVFLIADHISKGNEMAVAAHELMHKHGQDVLGKDGWDRMHDAIGGWEHAQPGSQENAVYQYANSKAVAVGDSRVNDLRAAAKKKGEAPPTKEQESAARGEISNQELFPYAVEAAFKMGIKPSMAAQKGTVARWLESVRQNMKMVWDKITNKPELFKSQDLVDLAFGIAQRENPDHAMGDFRGTTEAVTKSNDVVGKQGGRSADDTTPGTDEKTGLPLNSDGTVTVYHHTSKAKAESIRQTGTLKAQAEPDVYVTTRKETDTGYGDTAVPIRVNPDKLSIDDEFPNDRKDFRLNVGKPGGSIKVTVPNESTAPDSGGAMFSRTKETELPGDEASHKGLLSNLLDHALSPIETLSKGVDAAGNNSGVFDLIAPMSAGTQKTRAMSQSWINNSRKADYQWRQIDKTLTTEFTLPQRTKMWEAADQENDMRRNGVDTKGTGQGVDGLTPKERSVLDTLHAYSKELWNRAKDVGMVTGEGVDYWTPRMMVVIGENGEYTKPSEGKQGTSEGVGRNFSISASSSKQRKYELSSETEQAMIAKGGALVRDIRTMPLAMAKLEKAIAGRELINQIKELGQATGKKLVSTTGGEGFFTLDHPAFKTYGPRFDENGIVNKEDGTPVMDAKPIYISDDFRGPLKAILSQGMTSNKIYTGYMLLKSKSMSAIMYSPLVHNQVILGRALAYGGVKTPLLYFTGHTAKVDTEFMQKMIGAGMVPIGTHNNMLDVGDIAGGAKPGSWMDPDESWIGLGAQKAGNAIKQGAGDKIKAGIDYAGDIIHNKLLWERVGDLQAGIAKDVYNKLTAKGLDENAATTVAAHIANRYAGAVGKENMSELTHMVANITLFSKSFNAGNVGSVKDAFYGLPAGLKAQLMENSKAADAIKALDFAKHKARIGLVRDAAFAIVITSLVQNWVKRDKDKDFGEQVSEGLEGYQKRAAEAWANAQDNPLKMNSYNPYRLSSTWENEPEKRDRVDMGAQENGRHEYMRLPTGKVIEDLYGWTMHPWDTAEKKKSPLMSAIQRTKNQKDPWGTPVWDENDPNTSHFVWDLAKALVGTQMPLDQAQTMSDMANGHGTELDKDKMLGNITGLSYSQGHPQGPEAAVAAKVEERVTNSKKYVMELVKHDLKVGNEDKASERLENIGLTPREVILLIRRLQNPRTTMTPMQRKRFNQHANEDERNELNAAQ